MIIKEDVYKKAFEAKKNALREKQTLRETAAAAAYNAEPRLTEIDRLLSSIGASLAIAALSGADVTNLKKQSEALSREKKVLLDKFGVQDIKYDCPLCSDTGYVNGRICGCVKHLVAAFIAEEMSEEMPLGTSRFDNFDLKYYPDKDTKDGNPRRRMTKIFKTCYEYAFEFDPKTSGNLLFMGDAGLGKTHLTLAMVGKIIEKGFVPVYGSAENLFSQIEKEKFTDGNRGAYDAMIKSDLLVIDDLGAEMATPFSKSALYNLVNTRLLANRPTVINTNLTMKEIEARYTPRISSRLIGSFASHKFIGSDIRQQMAVEKLGK